jgi:hypothetical protein
MSEHQPWCDSPLCGGCINIHSARSAPRRAVAAALAAGTDVLPRSSVPPIPTATSQCADPFPGAPPFVAKLAAEASQ